MPLSTKCGHERTSKLLVNILSHVVMNAKKIKKSYRQNIFAL